MEEPIPPMILSQDSRGLPRKRRLKQFGKEKSARGTLARSSHQIPSSQQILHNLPVHIGEPVITSLEAIGEFLMIKP